MARHFGWLDADASGCVSAEDWGALDREMGTENWGAFGIELDGGQGAPRILWNDRKNVAYIPSPVVYENVFYMVRDGIVSSLDPQTGKVLKRGRLARGKMKVYASPVAGDGKVYFAGVEGRVAVVKAEGDWEVLALNDLGDEIYASPAIVDGRLYVRTRGRLYCFGARPTGEGGQATRGDVTPAPL
jgi:outer membrane protein assembly factor BamB